MTSGTGPMVASAAAEGESPVRTAAPSFASITNPGRPVAVFPTAVRPEPRRGAARPRSSSRPALVEPDRQQ